ncbi:MAG: acyl-CoA dehydrogenase family protein [Candidatus Melainabacteria bacterium]|nr:acyl-CoA dehydrogenase family protein [Candidatus Melainabacteria bacterium]
MYIDLTNEHCLIANSAKDFARREIYPKIKEYDENESLDLNIIKKMGAAGFLGICIPQEYNGQGLDYISLGLVCLEFEKIDTSCRFILTAHLALNSIPLLIWGNENQKRKYLIPQVKGDKIATFAMAEPNAGSDINGIQMRAEYKNNFYILNGEKTWITLANVAHHFLIFAKINKGISAFIVERNFPGVTTSTIYGKLGIRALNTGSISLQDVKVPKENLLGEEGEGLKVAMSALNNGLYTIGSGSVGIIEACLEASIKYAHERETFGKEIGRHELVKQMIAKMVAARDIGRLLIYNTGYLKNTGKANTRESFLTKWINSNNAFESANDALQILGAYGYCNEFDIERYFRNARGALIYGLTREIHTLIQAEYILGYRTNQLI